MPVLGSRQAFTPEQIALLSLVEPWVVGLMRQRLAFEAERLASTPQPAPNWAVQLEQVGQQVESALTARELEVARLMLSGCSSKEVARKLAISAETVKVHRKHIYAKLGIKSQSELFSLFLKAQRGRSRAKERCAPWRMNWPLQLPCPVGANSFAIKPGATKLHGSNRSHKQRRRPLPGVGWTALHRSTVGANRNTDGGRKSDVHPTRLQTIVPSGSEFIRGQARRHQTWRLKPLPQGARRVPAGWDELGESHAGGTGSRAEARATGL